MAQHVPTAPPPPLGFADRWRRFIAQLIASTHSVSASAAPCQYTCDDDELRALATQTAEPPPAPTAVFAVAESRRVAPMRQYVRPNASRSLFTTNVPAESRRTRQHGHSNALRSPPATRGRRAPALVLPPKPPTPHWNRDRDPFPWDDDP